MPIVFVAGVDVKEHRGGESHGGSVGAVPLNRSQSIARRVIEGPLSRYAALYRVFVLRDPFARSIRQWFADCGDSTLRLDYRIGEDDTVFDVGGYEGDWAHEIAKRYDPYIHVFEPVPEHAEACRQRFADNPKIRVHEVGLADVDGEARISVLGNESTLFRSGGQTVGVTLVDIVRFLEENGIERIAVVKINVEGGEYALLPRMVSSGLARRCENIQVQFHNFASECAERRRLIRESLGQTHRLTYDYPFVWENWQRKPASSQR